jgi:hypothetical protein
MKIKTIMSHHFTSTQMALIKKTDVSKDVEIRILITCWWECNMVQPLWKIAVPLHTCNPSTQRMRQLDLWFEASLDYMVRPYLKNK